VHRSAQSTPASSSLASASIIIGQSFNISYFPTDSHRNALSCARAPPPELLAPSILILPPATSSESVRHVSSSSAAAAAALLSSAGDAAPLYITPLYISQCTEIPFSNTTNTLPLSFASGASYIASFTINRHVKPLSLLRLQLNNVTIQTLNPNWR
jgi:hypothetical protein